MKSIKQLILASAIAAAVAAPAALAGYSATFQNVTFDFEVIDSDTFTFKITNADNANGDWAGVNFLSAFDIKDIGFDWDNAGAGATAFYEPIGPNYDGHQSQLGASNLACIDQQNGAKKSLCFPIDPDLPIAHEMLFTIDVTGNTLSITDVGPHLQIAFSNTDQGDKIGSLYSQNVPASTSSSSTSTSSTSTSSTSTSSTGGQETPEPGSIALIAMAMLGVGASLRKFAKRS
jgi:hypothetical protein